MLYTGWMRPGTALIPSASMAARVSGGSTATGRTSTQGHRLGSLSSVGRRRAAQDARDDYYPEDATTLLLKVRFGELELSDQPLGFLVLSCHERVKERLYSFRVFAQSIN